MSEKYVGGMNYEGSYFIVQVPETWTNGDPLPPPSPDDRWFDKLQDFTATLRAPWSRKPVHRRAWTPSTDSAPQQALPERMMSRKAPVERQG
jgi:hypothetical protein